MEHHANLVPWQMLTKRTGAVLDFVPLTDGFTLDLDIYHSLLETKPEDRLRHRYVQRARNHSARSPRWRRRRGEAGALVVVDGAQLVPHRAVDVETLGADFLAFSSHKMLGPTGIGVLWGKAERLEEMEPFEGGGEMISDVQLDHSTWAAVPHRFEAGTPPIIEAVGFDAAVEYLEKIGMDRVEAHDTELTAYALERLQEPSGNDPGPVNSRRAGWCHQLHPRRCPCPRPGNDPRPAGGVGEGRPSLRQAAYEGSRGPGYGPCFVLGVLHEGGHRCPGGGTRNRRPVVWYLRWLWKSFIAR